MDVRLVAATHRDLEDMVRDRQFRGDLYYRLNVFPIEVPPLRERAEDIPLLVSHFVRHFAVRIGKAIETIPDEAMEVLIRYSWPGNIRELQNVIERAVLLSSDSVLQVPLQYLRNQAAQGPDKSRSRTLADAKREHILATLEEADRSRTLADADREHILGTLKEAEWVLSGPNGAAARLGMSRSTLQFRMKKLGIVRPAERWVRA